MYTSYYYNFVEIEVTDPKLSQQSWHALELSTSLKRHHILLFPYPCISGRPLFPGSSTLDQIERIMATIPTPSKKGEHLYFVILCLQAC